jgi:hypothetical protein
MVIRGGEFICHLGEFDFGFVCKQCLVVEYLVLWDDAASGHSHKCTTAGKNEFALAVILEGIAPGGVEVHVVMDHDVAVAKAGDKGEMARLIHVNCVFQINDPDEDVMCNSVCSWCRVADRHCYVGGIRVVDGTGGIDGANGTDALALSSHVTHLSFFRFRKILGNIFYIDEGLSAVAALSNGFQPCCFWGETGSGMQVANGGLKAW